MLKIEALEVTPFVQNCRILFCSETSRCVVIDPGGDSEKILGHLAGANRTLHEIWLTHSHLDHCGGVKKIKAATGARLIGHPDERVMRENVTQICRMYGLPLGVLDDCPEPDQFISGGEILELGNFKFRVLFTPGHSPGHLCFYCAQENLLIAGDTLFAGSIGRTDLPGGDHNRLIKSIRDEILTLPGETRVLSGHGPDTTVAREARSNPFLKE